MKHIYFLALTLGLSVHVHAQVASTYVFSQDTAPFSFINAGSLIIAGTADDATFSLNNIGFTFNYNNVNYTQFAVSSNGYITMGNSNPPSAYFPISGLSTGNIISALGSDLRLGFTFTASTTSGSDQMVCTQLPPGIYVGCIISATNLPAGTTVTAINGNTLILSQNALSTTTAFTYTCLGEIRVETVGIAPNRQCVIQWRNVGRFANNGFIDCFNFQIILHETSNTVEMAYDVLSASANAYTYQVGLRGILNSDFNSRTSTTSWQQSTASISNNGSLTMTSSIKPISGLRFIWVNTAVGVAENEQSFSFNVFPNPANDAVFVQMPATDENGLVEIMDVSGRVCMSWSAGRGTSLLSMNIETLPAGAYVIRVTTTAGRGSQRLMIQ
ncbi:MAG: T9SS type A sorting domain-containing protein [Bacteroidetes bacterium]|nr:T9SS type A sorting domain-containing protein [Bacteroidota bacterium]